MPSKPQPAFVADRAGLARVLQRRGKSFAVLELVQNALDAGARTVALTLEPVAGRPLARLVVEDDSPTGFADLSSAYTLFGRSTSAADPSLRGRFALGEKLVIAACQEATVTTTSGTVRFDGDERTHSRARRDTGTRFEGTLRATRAETDEALAAARRVLVPDGVTFTVNGQPVAAREPITEVRATLPTEFADDDGALRRTRRQCQVRILQPTDGEPAALYELGIPVVETGDRFHVDVQQKVPLSMERDNVTPGYLRQVRALVLEHTAHLLTGEHSAEQWVDDALETPDLAAETVSAVLDARFGPDRVIDDPSDREGTKIAVSRGMTVIPGRAFSRAAWQNIRRAGAALPAGQVTPSPRPTHPDAPEYRPLHPDGVTAGMRWAADLVADIASRCADAPGLTVRFADDRGWPYAAVCGGQQLVFNTARLPDDFFDRPPSDRLLRLVCHELAHAGPHGVSDHLDRAFADRGILIAARMALWARDEPGRFHGP